MRKIIGLHLHSRDKDQNDILSECEINKFHGASRVDVWTLFLCTFLCIRKSLGNLLPFDSTETQVDHNNEKNGRTCSGWENGLLYPVFEFLKSNRVAWFYCGLADSITNNKKPTGDFQLKSNFEFSWSV